MVSSNGCRIQAFAFFAVVVSRACASSFLSRAQNADLKDLTIEMQMSILEEIEGMLGGEGMKASDSRLVRIQEDLRTTFMSMPKNSQGRLGHAAVRYVLHSYFIQRHAWSVRGIGSLSTNTADTETVNGSSVTLQDKVEEFVQGAFERRLGANGLDLEELSVLAATYENLIRSEVSARLVESFRLARLDGVNELDVKQTDKILDVYMMGYILNLNYTALAPPQMQIVIDKIDKVYPTWGETREFLRAIRGRSSAHKSFFSRHDVEAMVDEIGDEYGLWQDKECLKLKSQLLAIEDRSIGYNGSGRVRLSSFYKSALHEGNWQFSESAEYLTQLGVLDTQDQDVPRVIIPNYINAPANCLASSKFYAVCCISECEKLMEQVEHRFAQPVATPAEIVEFVSGLESATVAGDRSLNQMLIDRLDEIANHHGGVVPLHGRLFAQWMHHAYPRECPYPHISGTTNPQTPRDYVKQQQKTLTASKEEMAEVVKSAKREADDIALEPTSDECAEWSSHEELYVNDGDDRESDAGTIKSSLKPLPYVSAVIAALVLMWRSTPKRGLCAAGGKDVFV